MLVSFVAGRNYPAALTLEPENWQEEELCNTLVRLVHSGSLELRFCDKILATDLDDQQSDAGSG